MLESVEIQKKCRNLQKCVITNYLIKISKYVFWFEGEGSTVLNVIGTLEME